MLRNLPNVLQVAAPNIHSQHQCRKVPFAVYPLQHLLFVAFMSMAFLTGVRWCLVEALICISLIFSDVDVFTCDFLKQCELNLLIQIGFLNDFSVLIFFRWPPLGHFLRAGVFSLKPLRSCEWMLSAQKGKVVGNEKWEGVDEHIHTTL